MEGGSRRVQERAVELVEGGGWREVARSLGVGCVCRRIQVGRKVVPSCEMRSLLLRLVAAMDMLSAYTVTYSSMEADELANVSADEDFDQVEDAPEALLADGYETLDTLARLRLRIGLWAKGHPKAIEELIGEFASRLEVNESSVQDQSSERVFDISFSLAGRSGQYTQRSHADAASMVWDAGTLRRLPNVEASLSLDGESIAGCRCFYPALDESVPLLADRQPSCESQEEGRSAPSSSWRWADGQRIAESFGTELAAKLGGARVLLQLLGAVCADSGASAAYAKALPFGLPADLVAVIEPGARGQVFAGSAIPSSTTAAVVQPHKGPAAKLAAGGKITGRSTSQGRRT